MLKSITRYGEFNSYDLLKVIAITTMFIDHIGMFFYPDIEIFRVIGRMAYILFVFCVGYNRQYTFSPALLGLAILMFLFDLVLEQKNFTFSMIPRSSILFSIIIVRLVMQYITPTLTSYKLPIINFILWCMAIPTLFLFQYGTAGIAISICGYLAAIHKNDFTYRIFLLINIALYCYLEQIKWNFHEISSYLLLFEFLIIFKLLAYFNIHTISVAKYYEKLLLFISRNSLILYFIHYELFLFCSKFLMH